MRPERNALGMLQRATVSAVSLVRVVAIRLLISVFGLVCSVSPGLLHPLHSPSTDPIVRVVSVGRAPGLLIVDAWTGRAFVLNLAVDDVGNPTGPGTVSVLNASSGALLRTVTLDKVPSSMIVDPSTGHVFVASIGFVGANVYPNYPAHGRMSVLDAANGALLRTASVGAHPASLALDQRTRHVFVVNGDGLSVLDAATGAVLHVSPLVGSGSGYTAVDEQAGRVFVSSYEPSRVSVYDASSGRCLRTLLVGDHPAQVAVDSQTGRVFVSDANNEAREVNILDTTGAAVLRTTVVGRLPGKIIVAERTQRAFVLTHGVDGGVSTLDARFGTLIRNSFISAQVGDIALDTGANRLYVTSDKGVSVLDARRGKVLRTVAVGGDVGAIAVDARTRRVFVVNRGRDTVSVLDAMRL